MKYDPRNYGSRRHLANAIQNKMVECGFQPEPIEGTIEEVFSRNINEKVRVLVYTTIVDKECRAVGKDAIRVCALYRNKEGKDKGICKANKRVNRVGDTNDIVTRVHERMREVWRIASRPECCRKCGSPMFTSKRGKKVCANICWA